METRVYIVVAAVVAGVLSELCDASFTFHDHKQAAFLRSLEDYHVVFPSRVTEEGNFLSHVIHHERTMESTRRRRDVSEQNRQSPEEKIHYKLSVKNMDLHLRLQPNDRLLSPSVMVERRKSRYLNVSDSKLHRISHNRCHFTGDIKNHDHSRVALATCGGLTGLLKTSQGDYFIEPVKGHITDENTQHPHVVYKHQPHLKHQHHSEKHHRGTCGVTDHNRKDESRREEGDKEVEDDEDHQRRKRSISRERYVETLVVLDRTMVEYYQDEDLELYILTVMNIVVTIYHDATLGNAVNIVLVRIMMLENDEPDLRITHHADRSLASFCRWQKAINPNVNHPNHHDVAVLITRKDICSGMDIPCFTLGLAQVNGMCQKHRSCNINEDNGLAVAVTIAHELGHNFGMRHDTLDNNCRGPDPSKSQLIMSASLYTETFPILWSNCSRKAITRFLDRGWGSCLDDEPEDHGFQFPSTPPGVMYDPAHQCRLQYTQDASFCSGIDDANICSALWCKTENRCLTRLQAAAEGTTCGQDKWCFNGECVPIGERPEAVNGEWGQWGSWSACSRSCGGGVMEQVRHCDYPPPQFGGRYCLGQRHRFRICNTDDCPGDTPSFRAVQCSEFDYQPIRNGLYEWEPVPGSLDSCQLHCRPKNKYFSVKLKDSATDGTPCRPGTKNLCIHGICRPVGCDWKLHSNATEDRCGICHGDGTTCETVEDKFELEIGDGYVDAKMIPEGARNIRVEEVAEANNYLAIRDKTGKYFLNGHWFINWSGDYEAAGTVIKYERDGNKEALTAPGPLKESIYVMLLFQSQNPGVKFIYTVPKENVTYSRMPEFMWVLTDWTHCTVSCGGGSQRRDVICTEREAGHVEDTYCDPTKKPDRQQRACNDQDCPARWHAYPWQHCSVSCGKNGTQRRTVLCVQRQGDSEMALDEHHCSGLVKPAVLRPCKNRPSCSFWRAGPWSQTCGDDPCNTQARQVECVGNGDPCDNSSRPATERQCGEVTCGTWQTDNWSQCTRSCGTGIQFRRVTCEGASHCRQSNKPAVTQTCNAHPCKTEQKPTEKTVKSDKQGHVFNSINKIGKQINSGLDFSSEHVHLLPDGEMTITNHVGEEIQTDDSPTHHVGNILTDDSIPPVGSNTVEYNTLVENEKTQTYLTPVNPTFTTLPHTVSNIEKTSIIPVKSTTSMSFLATTLPPDTATPTSTSRMPSVSSTKQYNPDIDGKKSTKADDGHLSGADLQNQIIENPVEMGKYGPDTNVIHQDLSEKTKGGRHKKELSTTVAATAALSSGKPEQIILKTTKEPSLPAYSVKPSAASSKFGYIWMPGPWNMCSKLCGNGTKERGVECISVKTSSQVADSFCEHVPRPSTNAPCNTQPCPSWEVHKWGPCSKPCGSGLQRRDVICPEHNKCDPKTKPDTTQTCYLRDCIGWVAGPWSQCTKSCGGGEQARHIQCVNETSLQPSSGCNIVTKPIGARACNTEDCPKQKAAALSEYVCQRDQMASHVCRMLKRLCSERYIELKCCFTCAKHRNSRRRGGRTS